MGLYSVEGELEDDYFPIESISDEYDSFDINRLSPMEDDILKVLNTYLTIMKYLLHKPVERKTELKKNVKRIKKIKKSLLCRDGDVKKYLDEEGQYYDLL